MSSLFSRIHAFNLSDTFINLDSQHASYFVKDTLHLISLQCTLWFLLKLSFAHSVADSSLHLSLSAVFQYYALILFLMILLLSSQISHSVASSHNNSLITPISILHTDIDTQTLARAYTHTQTYPQHHSACDIHRCRVVIPNYEFTAGRRV